MKSSLFSFKCRDLLLKSWVFGLLVSKMSFHFLLDSHKLVWQGFLNVLGLHGQHTFQSLFFRFKNWNFPFVEIHLFLDGLDHFLCTLSKKCVKPTSRFMSFPLREAGLPEMLPWVWLNPPVPPNPRPDWEFCIAKMSFVVVR